MTLKTVDYAYDLINDSTIISIISIINDDDFTITTELIYILHFCIKRKTISHRYLAKLFKYNKSFVNRIFKKSKKCYLSFTICKCYELLTKREL